MLLSAGAHTTMPPTRKMAAVWTTSPRRRRCLPRTDSGTNRTPPVGVDLTNRRIQYRFNQGWFDALVTENTGGCTWTIYLTDNTSVESLSLFVSEHGVGKRWVLLQSLSGHITDTNAIAKLPEGWQVQPAPAVTNAAYFTARKDPAQFKFLLSSLAPHDWQEVAFVRVSRARSTKGWIVFRLPHDPYNGGSEKENAVSLDHLKYGTRLRFVCLAR